MHSGSMDNGHYIAIGSRNNRYYLFNDEKVNETEKVVQKDAYILIYRRIE